MDELLQIRFVGGADVKPPNARSREIAQVIDAYEDAIATTVIEQYPELKKDSIRVSLVGVQDESIGLSFVANFPQLSIPAAEKIAVAIQQGDYDRISDKVRDALRKIVSFASRHQCDAHLITRTDEKIIDATITPATSIPKTFDLVGETVIYGEVKRAGGIEPTVELHTIDGKTLFCPTTEAIAIELGRVLYQQVAVKGNATWDFQTFQIERFVIGEILPYQKLSLPDAFLFLGEAANGAFDRIDDVNHFVASQRQDGDSD